jgi:hypothetical protein
MSPEKFLYPLMAEWLQNVLTTQAVSGRMVAACAFPRLPSYFSLMTLQSDGIAIPQSVLVRADELIE